MLSRESKGFILGTPEDEIIQINSLSLSGLRQRVWRDDISYCSIADSAFFSITSTNQSLAAVLPFAIASANSTQALDDNVTRILEREKDDSANSKRFTQVQETFFADFSVTLYKLLCAQSFSSGSLSFKLVRKYLRSSLPRFEVARRIAVRVKGEPVSVTTGNSRMIMSQTF
jgi:hypothetical protein